MTSLKSKIGSVLLFPAMDMKYFNRKIAVLTLLILGSIFWKCGGDFEPDYEIVGCRVIKTESCSTDTLCLLVADIPYPSNKRLYDDTLTVDGVQYTGVLKTHNLPPRYQLLGEKLRIEFNVRNSQANECAGRVAYEVQTIEILNALLASYVL
jgi:hypothetical protein